MTRSLFLIGACAGALICSSFVGVRADENPTPTTTESKPKPLQGITSISVDFPTSSPRDAQALLGTTVSFAVKDASFAVALDALLNASGKTCRIECRHVKPMRLTFSAINEKSGDVLDALAKAGGCELYVFPDKLLVSPPDLLSKSEKESAPTFNALLPPTSPQLGGGNGQFKVVSTAAHTIISESLENVSIGDATEKLFKSMTKSMKEHISYEYRSPLNRFMNGIVPTFINLSLDNVTFGDGLNTVANLGGCNVYLLPDKFLICAPDMLTPAEKKMAVPAFSTLGDPSLLSDPSS